MGRRVILLLVLGALAPRLKSELLPIRTYTTADGLAADQVDCIVPDSRGFLWFCTPEGLSRFDGYHFVSYGIGEGLASRSVSTLLETRGGEHLVGTARGISRINAGGYGGRFTTYAPGQSGENAVSVLLESSTGKIWGATRTRLFEWNTASGFQPKDFHVLAPTAITSMVEVPDSGLWIGTTSGIYLVGEKGVLQTLHVQDGLPGEWVESLVLDSHGRLWAALRGGLAMIGRRPDGWWGVEKVFTEKSGLVNSDVKSLAAASDGTLWVGTTQGISRLRLDSGDPVVFQNLTRAQGLSDRIIIALAEDQAGNMWAGTEGAGVMRIDRLGFTTYREQDGLHTDRVFSVLEDRGGEILAVTMAGTAGKSVNVFDGVRFHTVVPKDYATWGWNQIFLQSRTGEWWAASKKGLCRYAAVNASELQARKPEVCYSRDDNEVFRIFEDSRGGIWASAQSKRGDQLMRWDPGAKAVTYFPSPRVIGEPADDLVSAFAEDRQGNIWMGRLKGGVYRYDGRGFRLLQQSDGVPAGAIMALLADGAGLWIGSNGGLGHLIDTADEHARIESYGTARGMASDTVRCIVKDRQGLIYLGTSKGVDQLQPATGYIRHFSSGLPHGEFTSAVLDRSGSLWFATRQGLSRITPADVRPHARPRVFITDLRVGGAPYPISQIGETRISRLELKPSENQLQVDFVGLDYEPGEVLRYSYKLEGADSSWSPPRTQLSVNYASLNSGKYGFWVKAMTSEGVESESPAGIEFTVLPPVWRRWWFETLAVALLAALVFAAHRYRLTHMVNLERMRTAIATDLHDDIGASLSHIAVLSEVARAGVNGENQRTQESLQRVAALARELVDSLGDVVWSIRTVPDGIDSLVSRMREFALELLAGQGIDFELRSPAPSQNVHNLSLQARRNLFLMFKESVHNIARHSGCTAVRAELEVANRALVLTVVDNGRGLNPVARPNGHNGGNGIPGMRRRAELLGGEVQVLSRPGEGCTVCIRLPLRPSLFAKPRAV